MSTSRKLTRAELLEIIERQDGELTVTRQQREEAIREIRELTEQRNEDHGNHYDRAMVLAAKDIEIWWLRGLYLGKTGEAPPTEIPPRALNPFNEATP